MPKLFFAKRQITLLLILFIILLGGLILRHISMSGGNLVFDFDQIEDQFYTYTIAHDLNPAIIGRAVYGDPRLHHGVFYYYYNLIPFLISGGNLFVSVYWNGLFNVSSGIVLFILARLLFNRNLPGIIAAFITAFSFEFIKFSNWLTIDTVAIFLVPLFYLGLWGFYKRRFWSYILLPISLGFCIQSDLSLLYLIPVGLLFWVIFKPKLPGLKLLLLSTGLFLLSISTLIITEIKLQFAGIKFFLNFSANFHSVAKLSYPERFLLFFEDFFKNFTNNLLPNKPGLGIYLALPIILLAIYYLHLSKTGKDEKKSIIFLLFYLFSPVITLILGYHNTPWFLIGLTGAVVLISGYVISKFKPIIIIPLLLIIGISQINVIISRPLESYKLFDSYYDSSSYLAYQLGVVDYTYQQAAGQPFAINSVTYPLYYNAMWEYLYNWYGREKFGYVPTWLGGDQLYPYNLLAKSKGEENYFYMIFSRTNRIPKWEEDRGKVWAAKYGKLIKGKENSGFLVQKYERNTAKP